MEATESQVTINFTTHPEAEARDAIERSFATLRKRADQRYAARRATDDALARVVPLPKDRERFELAEDDPAAVAAAEAMAREHRAFVDEMTLERPNSDGQRFTGGSLAADAGASTQVVALPFGYDWHWANGGLVFANLADHNTGRIDVSAVAQRRVDAHAGIGIGFTSDHDHFVTARSLRRSSEKAHAWSSVTGAVSLTEGGMEMTVLEGPNLLGVASEKRFRIRLNPGFWGSPEDRSYDSGGFGTGGSIEVTWFAQAGHSYAINVGAWVTADWTEGPHASGPVAAASGAVVADASAITLFHH